MTCVTLWHCDIMTPRLRCKIVQLRFFEISHSDISFHWKIHMISPNISIHLWIKSKSTCFAFLPVFPFNPDILFLAHGLHPILWEDKGYGLWRWYWLSSRHFWRVPGVNDMVERTDRRSASLLEHFLRTWTLIPSEPQDHPRNLLTFPGRNHKTSKCGSG